MIQYNVKKIFFGLFLVALGIFTLFSAFYFFSGGTYLSFLKGNQGITPSETLPKTETSPDPQTVKTQEIPQDRREALKPQKDVGNAKPLVQANSELYNEEETSRTEGLLWVDREDSKFFVTLGAIHGLKAGDFLTVYDGKKRVGRVKVATVMDVISYVLPIKNTEKFFDQNYYQVAIE